MKVQSQTESKIKENQQKPISSDKETVTLETVLHNVVFLFKDDMDFIEFGNHLLTSKFIVCAPSLINQQNNFYDRGLINHCKVIGKSLYPHLSDNKPSQGNETMTELIVSFNCWMLMLLFIMNL